MFVLSLNEGSLHRLQMEHGRMIEIISSSAKNRDQPSIIADMMAGVGPFAIPLAKVGLTKYEALQEPAKKKQKKEANQQIVQPNLLVYANGWLVISCCV